MDPKDLTPEQRKEALAWFMFLVEKRDGRIKARGVADGSKQRQKPGYKKDDASSPTVSNEGVMISCAIEAHQRSDVACIDIPGAFLHAMTDEEIIMLLRGPLAEMMVMINPQLYRKYVTQDGKGEAVLYVKLNKALYGLLQSALLFYKKLRGELEGRGFKINDYDPCVAHKDINGHKMIVTWHVDDLKVSHKDPFEITRFAAWLSGIYGEDLTVHKGKVHDYFRMDLDYSTPGKLGYQ